MTQERIPDMLTYTYAEKGSFDYKNKLNTEPLITHTYPLERIHEVYDLFEKKADSVIKIAVEC